MRTRWVGRGRWRGFTLVELLVVVAIIGILLFLLVPNIAGATERARQASCAANLHALLVATQTAAADSDNWYPPIRSSSDWPYYLRYLTNNLLLSSYGITRGHRYCPSNRRDWNFDRFWNWSMGGQMSVWGYVYLAKDVPNVMSGWSTLQTHTRVPVFPTQLTDNPSARMLWVDVTRE